MGISFGSFDGVCQQAALVICPLMGSSQGIEPTCYSRNVQVGNTIIFQPGTSRDAFKPRLLCILFSRFVIGMCEISAVADFTLPLILFGRFDLLGL